MTGKEVGSGFRICPGCGVVLPASLPDQFFCESCGSPLVEEEQQSALPDWLQNGPVEYDGDGAGKRLEPAPEPGRPSVPPATRIELRPTGAAIGRRSADPQPTGVSCALILGIVMFLFALGMLCWVLFAITRTRAVEPASLLTVPPIATVFMDHAWPHADGRVSEEEVTSIRHMGRAPSFLGKRARGLVPLYESVRSLSSTLTGIVTLSELYGPRFST
jgi:hypothetical protein